jgi:DMSO reductase anchor subunit
MQARYILSLLAGVFLVFGGLRVMREGGRLDPAARTWLLIAVIFGVVSLWLWVSRAR